MIVSNDFAAQWRDIRDDALSAVDRVGASGWLVLGKEVEAFEADLARAWGLPHAVGCGNGLDALDIALRATGLEPGAKVLTTPLSAFATTLAILRAGGTPVFVDVDDDGLLDLELCERELAADPSLRTFVPVHLYGQPLDPARLAALKDRFGLTVIEDCAQAIGATSHGLAVGTVGDAACTSFYPTKNLGCMGDGGALLTKHPAIAARARALRDYGQTAKYVHTHLGMNSRLDELHAAILRSALLPRLAGFNARRSAIAEAYLARIRHPALRLPQPRSDVAPAWHLFPVRVAEDRDGFREHLRRLGVASAIHYPVLIPDQPAIASAGIDVRGELSRARQLAASEVSLPMHPYLTDEMVDSVVGACNGWRA
jgi:dTDP-3-amino-3,4,6-trideoxy-alpha-D-glucose transaminase